MWRDLVALRDGKVYQPPGMFIITPCTIATIITEAIHNTLFGPGLALGQAEPEFCFTKLFRVGPL